MRDLHIFDIDGTLLDVIDTHLKTYLLVYKELLKISVPPEKITNKFGKPESLMHEEICREFNINPNDRIFQTLISKRAEFMEGELIMQNTKPLPGVVDTLEMLKKRSDYIAVISGNLERVGKLLLNLTGLKDYFKISGFDDGSGKNRAEILNRVINKAEQMNINYNRIFVVGDTPSDFEAGKTIGATTVLVATGSFSRKELEKTGANYVLGNLLEYKGVLENIQ